MRHWVYVLPLIAGVFAPEGALAQARSNDSQLTQTFTDWANRQGLLKTVRYVITGTMEFKDKDLPSGKTVWPERTVLLLDFESQRYRVEFSEHIKRQRPDGNWE